MNQKTLLTILVVAVIIVAVLVAVGVFQGGALRTQTGGFPGPVRDCDGEFGTCLQTGTPGNCYQACLQCIGEGGSGECQLPPEEEPPIK